MFCHYCHLKLSNSIIFFYQNFYEFNATLACWCCTSYFVYFTFTFCPRVCIVNLYVLVFVFDLNFCLILCSIYVSALNYFRKNCIWARASEYTGERSETKHIHTHRDGDRETKMFRRTAVTFEFTQLIWSTKCKKYD